MSAPRAVDADSQKPARPLPLIERPFDEAWLQDKLFRHPAVLPVSEVEPGLKSKFEERLSTEILLF